METNVCIESWKIAVDLIGKVVWPLVLMILVWRFQKPITSLIGRIKLAKIRDLEFHMEMVEVKEVILQHQMTAMVSESDKNKREEIAMETLTLQDIVDQLNYRDLDFLRYRATTSAIFIPTSKTDHMRIEKLAGLGLLENRPITGDSPYLSTDITAWYVTAKARKLLDAVKDSPTARMLGEIPLKDE